MKKLLAACTLIIFVLSIFSMSFAAPKTIKIGVNLELSQAVAQYGQKELQGLKLAIDEINQKGGVGGKRLSLL